MNLGTSKQVFGYDVGAATRYMIGIILVPFLLFLAIAGIMIASTSLEQRQQDNGPVTWLLRLVCFGILAVGGYFYWFLRVVRTDRIAVYRVYDNGLAYGTTADAFTMRLAVDHRAVIAWGDIAELREHGSRSGLRVLLPPGKRYRLDVVTRDGEVLRITGAIQGVAELTAMIRAHVG
ncbi:hypothetical protein [Actinoplanes subtropicus]|uniref:hypothetical protein n=1 Tax=Actinoplanes subtropicus TaxID=543632 RepID=UPI0004C3E48B|nr:hypothetical protein [Actinoplanes subtropicus]